MGGLDPSDRWAVLSLNFQVVQDKRCVRENGPARRFYGGIMWIQLEFEDLRLRILRKRQRESS